MKGRLHAMSEQEVDRLEVIQKMEAKVLSRKAGAELLGLSCRQAIRLLKAYRRDGAKGLISKRRGQRSNRAYSASFKETILEHVQQSYSDFGPTLAAEKLLEQQALEVNRETLRLWMLKAGLWKGKRRKASYIHQQRSRRPCVGELVQIDGSHHDWFEGRAPKCCLLVFIDDATSRLLELRFVEAETTAGYFYSTRRYIERHGRPLAFYSDKHGVFRVNIAEAKESTGKTQFGRAMKELGIDLICANSPQAKGRVERANGTLQDRLVKELRLKKINSIETANAFLPAFMMDYNKRFAVTPVNPEDAHRTSVPNKETLDLIFSWQHKRKLSKNLELSYRNVIYQMQTEGKGYGLRQSEVTVIDDHQGQIIFMRQGKKLAFKIFNQEKRTPTTVIDSKKINKLIDLKVEKQAQGHKPKADHPWRQYDQTAVKRRVGSAAI